MTQERYRLTSYVTEEEHKELRVIAAERGITMAELLRQTMRALLEKEGDQ